MSIEKPISTIRKAIEGSAEQRASIEFLDKPEQRHYNEVFNFYRLLRLIQPKTYEKMITIGAKGKEISDELGKNLSQNFKEVMEEKTTKDADAMVEAAEKIKDDKNLSSEEMDEKLFELNNQFLNKMGVELRNDQRLISAFLGKEQLLDKVIDYTTSSSAELLKLYKKV